MYPYQNPKLPVEERVSDLLSRMTLREKVGQLTQRLYGFTSFERRGEEVVFSDEFKNEVEYYSGLGTLYGLHRADPWSAKTFETGLDGVLSTKATNQVQRYVIGHSRLGIPALLSSECPHGHQALDGYLLPVNLAAGATFDPELVKETAKVSGQQLKEMGIDLALVSCLDMLRDPRWGRSEECFGEDPYLASRMAEAVVEGIQSQGVDVTAKHMCGQGETTGGVNASAARIGQRELREIHLPPVKACVDAGVSSFMAAYNEVDGVYCHGNPWLLTELLRGEYGFTGFVMSDGVAIDQLDAVTGDRTASGALALNAGVDMGLWDTGFQKLEEALDRGLVTQEKIDEAVRRVLTVKFRRGLFENPYVPETDHWRHYNYENYPQVKRLAEQTPVLLKNSGILPLSAEKPMKLALIGPNADAIYNQLGDYTPPVRPGWGITVRRGLEELLSGTAVELIYHPGCPMFDSDEAMMAAAVDMAKDCDIIVNVVGGSSSRFAVQGEFDSNGAMKKQSAITMDCGENVDNASLRLPGQQLVLMKCLKELGKPVITVVIAGRPYESCFIDQLSDALVYSFYPGLTGGEALAKLLFGQIEPAGRLNASIPNEAHQLPCYYNHKDSYRPMTYYDGAATPKYGFGCGLSYTSFGFELLTAPTAEKQEVTFAITNTGSRPGYAVPQLYIHRTQGAVTSRIRQLCGFTKLYLQPGERREVTLAIPEESLRQFDYAMRSVLLPGRVEWFLGDSGENKHTGSFIL
ncbi:MAG: glycoside hydrolase family 3 C-terminal domain-containing protein [Oscillospiraceae bacterium]|nr:glycoside hydrolase family 3 C-terminal domain-containing protein [Oscillospiraceae bacterium]